MRARMKLTSVTRVEAQHNPTHIYDPLENPNFPTVPTRAVF